MPQEKRSAFQIQWVGQVITELAVTPNKLPDLILVLQLLADTGEEHVLDSDLKEWIPTFRTLAAPRHACTADMIRAALAKCRDPTSLFNGALQGWTSKLLFGNAENARLALVRDEFLEAEATKLEFPAEFEISASESLVIPDRQAWRDATCELQKISSKASSHFKAENAEYKKQLAVLDDLPASSTFFVSRH